MTRPVATKEVFDNTIKVSPAAATFSGLFSKSEKLQGRMKDVSTQTPDVSTSPKLVLQGEDLKEYQEFLRHKMSSEPTLIPPVYPTAQTEQPAPISYTMGFSEAKYSDSKESDVSSDDNGISDEYEVAEGDDHRHIHRKTKMHPDLLHKDNQKSWKKSYQNDIAVATTAAPTVSSIGWVGGSGAAGLNYHPGSASVGSANQMMTQQQSGHLPPNHPSSHKHDSTSTMER